MYGTMVIYMYAFLFEQNYFIVGGYIQGQL